MSLNNIQNLLKNQNISWESLQKTLKDNNADQSTIDQAKSLFDSIDKNGDGTINDNEWGKYDEQLRSVDSNDNEILEDFELEQLDENNEFRNAGSDLTNKFLKAMATDNPENPDSKPISEGGGATLLVRNNMNSITMVIY